MLNIVETSKLLADKAILNDITVEQVDSYTLQDIQNILNLNEDDMSNVSFTVLNKIRRRVKAAIIVKNDENIRDAVKSQLVGGVRTWLMTNYPNAEWDASKIKGKLCIELWPFGKPLVIEEDE